MPCSLVEVYQSSLLLVILCVPEDGSSTFLQIVDKILPGWTTSYTRRQCSSSLPTVFLMAAVAPFPNTCTLLQSALRFVVATSA